VGPDPTGPVPASLDEPAPPARGVFTAVLLAAVVGALALPAWRVGIGWLVALVAVAGAIVVARSARRRPDGGGPGTGRTGPSTRDGHPATTDNQSTDVRSTTDTGPNADVRADGNARSTMDSRPTSDGRLVETTGDRAWRIAAAAAATALVGVAGFRAAGWLVAICLCAGLLLSSYALAGGRSWARLLRGLLALAPASALALGWAATRSGEPRPTATHPGDPRPTAPASGSGERSNQPTGPQLGRIVAAVAVGLVLLAVFGSLFRSADPAFARLTGSMVRAFSPDSLVRAALGFVIVGMLALGATYLTANPLAPERDHARHHGRRRLGLAEWVIPLVMLDVLFGLFVWVQITVLFAGDEFVLGPGGPDYAVYARGGSAQLGVVTILTLGVLAVLARWAGRTSRLELGLLRLLGGVLCGLTMVIVASALTRLNLYAHAYGLTVARLLAFAGQVWVGLVVVLVASAGVRLRATWLPRAVTAAAIAVLLGLVAVNPEAVIARTVLSRLDGPYPVDYAYLTTLSPDAIDVLRDTSLETRNCPWRPVDLTPDPWYAYNYSRAHARDVMRQLPKRSPTCY
jgi:hypothetical protein